MKDCFGRCRLLSAGPANSAKSVARSLFAVVGVLSLVSFSGLGIAPSPAEAATKATAKTTAKGAKQLTLKNALSFGCSKPIAGPNMATMPKTGGATVAVLFDKFDPTATGCVSIAVRTGTIPTVGAAGSVPTAPAERTIDTGFASVLHDSVRGTDTHRVGPTYVAAAPAAKGPLLSVTVGQAFPQGMVQKFSGLQLIVSGLQVMTEPTRLPNGKYLAAIRRHNVPNDLEVIEMTAYNGQLSVDPRRAANGTPVPFELVVPLGATFVIYQPGTPLNAVLPADIDGLQLPDAKHQPVQLDPTPPHDFPEPGATGRPAPSVGTIGTFQFHGNDCPGGSDVCDFSGPVWSDGPGAIAYNSGPIHWAKGGKLDVQMNIGYMGLSQAKVVDCPPEWEVNPKLDGSVSFNIVFGTSYKQKTISGCSAEFSTCTKKGGSCYGKTFVVRIGFPLFG